MDFETGSYVLRVFNDDELLLGFIARGVATMGLFCEIGLGVERYGVTKTEVSGL